MNPGGVHNPITPEESKAQMVDAAREIIAALDLDVLAVKFRHASCNDDGVAPFRGDLLITYPLAASEEESEAEIATMTEKLRSIGWGSDPNLHTHGTDLTKNNIVADLGPQLKGQIRRAIQLYGECRDITTSQKYGTPYEEVDLG